MQHYGAPTSLIDWTYSPFVAAFFAMENLNKGCHVYEINTELLYRQNKRNEFMIDDLIGRDLIVSSDENFLVTFSPEFQNERIIAQQGLFLIPSNYDVSFDDIADSYKVPICKKYIFNLEPQDIQECIRILKTMTIDNFRLFPGIEGLARASYLKLLEPTSRV
jgi:hypothetical protein